MDWMTVAAAIVVAWVVIPAGQTGAIPFAEGKSRRRCFGPSQLD